MTKNAKTLFDPNLEKDNCGFGLIAQRNGIRSRKLVKKSILGLTSMTHRGAIGADGKTGDGCGLLFDLNHSFFKLKVCLLYTSPSPRDKRQSRMPSSA